MLRWYSGSKNEWQEPGSRNVLNAAHASSGKKTIPDRSMIFELWGNIGLRKGDYKLWADVGRDHSPDWPALAAKLKDTNLSLFDLSKDVAETTDLRTQRLKSTLRSRRS